MTVRRYALLVFGLQNHQPYRAVSIQTKRYDLLRLESATNLELYFFCLIPFLITKRLSIT